MSSFTDIRTVYKNIDDRNINYLSSVYNDKFFLLETIKSLIDTHINDSAIFGKKVLLKPNWVIHNVKETDSLCLCTNENFILAAVEVILKRKPKSILIGDAPILGCRWDKLLSGNFYTGIKQLSDQYSIPIIIKDFRRMAYDLKSNKTEQEKNGLDDYLIFDVGDRSYLELITSEKRNFRVTCYDPNEMAKSHSKGVHKYFIIKELFDSDIIITLPKMKTHRMAGLTNSLKIIVGFNGDKDFLPHHRKGGEKNGGDCYPGTNWMRTLSENYLDEANRHKRGIKYNLYRLISKAFWDLSNPTDECSLNAGWYGNDTVWRMVFDLNIIAKYGKSDGTLSNEPQRTIYSLCDGIIGGQGDGPLNPEPLALGIVSFTNDAELMDVILGHIFRLNIYRIALLKEANQLIENRKFSIFLNGERISMKDIDKYSLDVIMPQGWINYNN